MFPATRTFRIGTLVGAGLLAAAAVTGCGGNVVSTGPTTGAAASSASANQAGSVAKVPSTSAAAMPHNQADVAFASSMIPHNVQTLASSQIATSKASRPQVKALAASLRKTQVPEIEALSQWLTSWGQPIPGNGIAGKGGSGLTQSDLTRLSQTSGGGFDTLWLNTMIKHQQSAVALAQAELEQGSSAEAKALAKKIVTAQQTQITAMKGLLKKA